MTEPPDGFTVTGGMRGIDAKYEDLSTLARLSNDASVHYAELTTYCHSFLFDEDLLASAVLDPGGVAAFEKALLGALDGRDGLSGVALELAEQAIGLKATVATYETTEQLQKDLFDGIRWAGGFALGQALPFLAIGAASWTAFGAGVLLTNPSLIPVALSGLPALGQALPGLQAQAQRYLLEHPGVLDGAIGAFPGLVTGLTGLPVADVVSGGKLFSLTYGPNDPAAFTLAQDYSNIPGTDQNPGSDPAAVDWERDNLDLPPRNLSDIMHGLDDRNRSVSGDPDQIDVRVIDDHGKKSYIVDIPGTKTWETPFDPAQPNMNNLETNLRLTGGETTAREQAIAQALAAAGATSTDPVMLVGHSQGGMLAAQAAADIATGTFDYNVAHVITAGSPIANTPIPPSVQVLALENQHDLVPHLEGAANPDRPNVTTVTFDGTSTDVGTAHGTDTAYLPAAQALDSSTDPSVAAFSQSASSFFPASPDAAASHGVYTIRRG